MIPFFTPTISLDGYRYGCCEETFNSVDAIHRMNEFYRENVVKGRKLYRCELCGASIHKGEHHYTMSGKSDGSFWSVRGHKACVEFYKDLIACEYYDTMDTPTFDALTEMIFGLGRDYVEIYTNRDCPKDAVIETYNYYQFSKL